MYFATENPYGTDAFTTPAPNPIKPLPRALWGKKRDLRIPPAPRLTDLVQKLILL